MKRLSAIRGNVPSEQLRWTLFAAAREFSISEPALGTRLNQAREHPGSDGCYTTGQVTKVIFGDLWAERYSKLKAETAKIELETAILRGDYLNRAELESMLGQIAEAILQVIKSSRLNRDEQNDLRRSIASIPIVIKDVAKVQAREFPLNGAEPKKRGRPPKKKS